MPGRSSRLYHVSANSIVSQLVKNGAHRTGSRGSTRTSKKELPDIWKVQTPAGCSIAGPFKREELAAALRHLKSRKWQGLDSIFLEFILHPGLALKSWFCDFFTLCMHQHLGEPKSCCPIFLVCVIFKIVERLTYVRVEPIIDSLLPQEQAGFRHGRTTVNQVTLLTQDIKDSFSAKKKSGAVFVNLTTAFDCMASWSHLQATAIATWLAHDSHDHGTGWQSQFHLYHQQRQTEHVTMPQKGSRNDASLHPFL